MAQTLGEIQAVLTTKGFKDFDKQLSAADKQMGKFSKSLSSFGDKAIKLGGTLTKSLTLPIAALGAASLKMAADFEVSSRKFAAAFEGASDEAAAAVNNLNESFGISNTEATRLLANTGDLLKGFGATSEEALTLSEDVQELAASLAAYNGVPVAQASQAITAALLGEREQLKQLGVVIRETDVSQQLLLEGKEDLTGSSRLLASAEATLALAVSQSSDAISSFADNTDTLAFQSQQLVGDIKDLAVELGTQLLPIAKQVVGVIGNVVERFADMDETGQKTILVMAGIAAGAGPAITAIGALSKAIAFLAANPVVAAVAGVAALTAGIVLLVKKNKEARFEEQYQAAADKMLEINENATSVVETIEEFARQTGITVEQSIQVAEEQGLITDEVRAQVEELRNANATIAQNGRTLEQNLEVQELISDAIGRGALGAFNLADEATNQELALEAAKEQALALAENMDVAYESVLNIGLANEQVQGYYREALETLKEQFDVQQEQARAELERAVRASGTLATTQAIVEQQEEQARLSAEQAAEEERINRELEEQEARREAIIQGRIDARVDALAKFEESQSAAQTRFELGLVDARGLLEEQISAARQQIEDLINADYRADEAWEETLGYQTMIEMTELIAQYEAQLADLDAQAEETAAAERTRAQEEEAAAQAAIDAENTRIALESQYTDAVFAQSASRLEILDAERERVLAEAERVGAETANIEAYYAAERQRILDEAAAEEDSRRQEQLDADLQVINERAQYEQAWLTKVAEQAGNRIYILEQERDEALAIAEEMGASTAAINAYYDNEIANLAQDNADEVISIYEQMWNDLQDAQNFTDFVNSFAEMGKLVKETFQATAGNILTIVGNIYSQMVTNAQAALAQWDAYHGDAIAAFEERLDAGEELNEQEIAQYEQLKEERNALLMEQYEAQVQAFRVEKAMKIANAIMWTAEAAIKAFNAVAWIPFVGPVIGAGLAAAIVALGAVYIGQIAKQQPPPPPKLMAEGGVVTSATNAIVGEAGPEAVLPLTDETYRNLGDGIVSAVEGTTSPMGGSGGMNLTIVMPGFGEAHINLTQDALDNGQVLVPASSVVRA